MQKLVSNGKIPAKVGITPCFRKPPQMGLAVLISICFKFFCIHFIYWGQVAHDFLFMAKVYVAERPCLKNKENQNVLKLMFVLL